MKKLFIHHPLFRLISPVFSGVIVYLLVLLIHNNVEQLQDYFLGEELYLCIGLSYLIQESTRAFLLLFQGLFKSVTLSLLLIQVTVAMLLCIGLTTISINLYFELFLGFLPTYDQLWEFNIIFSCITLIYILLHLSHHYLHKINSKKLEQEIILKEAIQDDFIQFKKGINTDLLFESFESLIMLIKENKEASDDLIDFIATVYRYILSRKNKQLVKIHEELEVLDALIKLFNCLPYRTVKLKTSISSNFLIVPGSLLSITENIIRFTIQSPTIELQLFLSEMDDTLQMKYKYNDKIIGAFTSDKLKDIQQVYSFYSDIELKVIDIDQQRTISLPKLTPLTQT